MSTYTEAKEFIKNATDKATLYSGVREILSADMVHYPEDWEIKTLQRLADAKYQELDEMVDLPSRFTIVNGIEVDLKDYIDNNELISQLMQDESFMNNVSFGFEKEYALTDDDISGSEILEMVVKAEIAKKTEINKLQNASRNTAENPVAKRKGR